MTWQEELDTRRDELKKITKLLKQDVYKLLNAEQEHQVQKAIKKRRRQITP